MNTYVSISLAVLIIGSKGAYSAENSLQNSAVYKTILIGNIRNLTKGLDPFGATKEKTYAYIKARGILEGVCSCYTSSGIDDSFLNKVWPHINTNTIIEIEDAYHTLLQAGFKPLKTDEAQSPTDQRFTDEDFPASSDAATEVLVDVPVKKENYTFDESMLGGLTKFVVERGKAELILSFMETKGQQITDDPHLSYLLPNTRQFLVSLGQAHNSLPLDGLKEAFTQDLNDLPLNVSTLGENTPERALLVYSLKAMRALKKGNDPLGVLADHSALPTIGGVEVLSSLNFLALASAEYHYARGYYGTEPRRFLEDFGKDAFKRKVLYDLVKRERGNDMPMGLDESRLFALLEQLDKLSQSIPRMRGGLSNQGAAEKAALYINMLQEFSQTIQLSLSFGAGSEQGNIDTLCSMIQKATTIEKALVEKDYSRVMLISMQLWGNLGGIHSQPRIESLGKVIAFFYTLHCEVMKLEQVGLEDLHHSISDDLRKKAFALSQDVPQYQLKTELDALTSNLNELDALAKKIAIDPNAMPDLLDRLAEQKNALEALARKIGTKSNALLGLPAKLVEHNDGLGVLAKGIAIDPSTLPDLVIKLAEDRTTLGNLVGMIDVYNLATGIAKNENGQLKTLDDLRNKMEDTPLGDLDDRARLLSSLGGGGPNSSAVQILTLTASIAEAGSPDGVYKILETAAAPVGAYKIKRQESPGRIDHVTLNSYLGMGGGHEEVKGLSHADGWHGGAIVPVGVELSWSDKECGIPSFSLLVSALDLGTYANYNTDSTTAPTYDFRTAFAPGVFAVFGLSDHYPFSFGIGGQYANGLRKENTDRSNAERKSVVRWSAFLGVDIPLILFK